MAFSLFSSLVRLVKYYIIILFNLILSVRIPLSQHAGVRSTFSCFGSWSYALNRAARSFLSYISTLHNSANLE